MLSNPSASSTCSTRLSKKYGIIFIQRNKNDFDVMNMKKNIYAMLIVTATAGVALPGEEAP